MSGLLLIAHGLVVRSDLPIPEWLFGWAAAMVLVVSFVGLAVLWPEPRLQEEGWRSWGATLGRVLTSRPVEILCGTAGVFLLGLVVYSGLEGTQSSTANFAPTFVYVVFWVGLVPVSVLFGDVFRAFNPWRAIGRAVAWVAQTAARGPVPAPLEYPRWLGRWPAVIGIFAFATMELVISDGSKPENIAIAALIYSALTFVAMALYGVEAWIERGEAFSVYFGLFARISPFERRGREIGLRKPLSALAALEPLPGTVPFVAVMIGSVTFDGAAEAPIWTNIAPDIANFFQNRGVAPEHARDFHPHAGADRARLRVRPLPDPAPVPGAGSARAGSAAQARLPRLRSARRRLEPVRHRRKGDQLRRDLLERDLVLPGPFRGCRARGRPDARARPRAGDLRPGQARRALPVLDAWRDDRLHESGPLATVAGEYLMPPIAHAGHWLISLSYFAPVIGFLIWLAIVQIRDRRRGDDD
jgi:hypothetical protein